MEPVMMMSTSAPSATNCPRSFTRLGCPASSKRKRSAFTLVELLVVIGIIVVIMGMLLVMLVVAYKRGLHQRYLADISTISTALDAYKSDFGDYPRPSGNSAGFAVLAEALVGPGPAALTPAAVSSMNIPTTVTGGSVAGQVLVDSTSAPTNISIALAPTGTSSGSFWMSANAGYVDGNDGPGWRMRANGGRVYGPYLAPDKWHMADNSGRPLCALLDPDGSPILYFAAAKPSPNIALPNGYAQDSHLTPAAHPEFDMADNWMILSSTSSSAATSEDNARLMFQFMLGDLDGDGAITSNGTKGPETALATAPYILWCAGPDRGFGFTYTGNYAADKKTLSQADDVTNLSNGP